MTKSYSPETETRAKAHAPLARAQKSWTLKRLLMGAIPAAGVTFGLFLAMDAMIGVDPASTENVPEVVFAKITPQVLKPDTPRSSRRPVQPIETSAPPPRPPSITAHKVENFIPDAGDFGKAPDLIKPTRMQPLEFGSININRSIRPIQTPIVTYPPLLAARGIEGSCEIKFDVNIRGEAFNIRPKCTDPGFERPAKRAVAKSRFAPQLIDGKPVIQKNVVYPIEFSMSGD